LPDADRRRPPRYLPADALRRVSAARRAITVYAVVVDALNDRAVDFYRRFCFIALPSRPKTLFLPFDSFIDSTEG
jgi:hypothetical protein